MQSSTTKQSYTSYKVQSNSYSSGNGGSRIEYDSSPAPAPPVANSGAENNRPGSRLKANIDELDTLLSDLNNAQTHRSNTTSHHHETSSEDYGDQSTHLQVCTYTLAQNRL